MRGALYVVRALIVRSLRRYQPDQVQRVTSLERNSQSVDSPRFTNQLCPENYIVCTRASSVKHSCWEKLASSLVDAYIIFK